MKAELFKMHIHKHSDYDDFKKTKHKVRIKVHRKKVKDMENLDLFGK
jgi:hypothetical protein